MSAPYPDRTRRMLISIPAMIASTMVAVDMTIANVALPHMQATLNTSQEQVMWVLTSYIVAGAIATPLSGWLAGRFGRKLVMLVSTIGFTVASAMCGASANLETIVFARIVQGACGASLVPLSQAMLLDIYPPEEHGKAMAIFGLGSMAGPIIGPTLGGWLTDSISWRWVFFINVPFGIFAAIGIVLYMIENRDASTGKFDVFGFSTVSMAIATFQLMIDRGEHLDWFDSLEIWIYAVIFALSTWLAAVHMFTARNTFLRADLFRDRNFAIGCIFSAVIGIVVFATIAPIVVMTQSLLGYSAFDSGLIGIPRAIGTTTAMLLVTRLIGKVDGRILLGAGLAIVSFGMLLYAHLDLYADTRSLLVIGLIHGFGSGLLFVPLSVMVFATLSQSMRNEGASMYALTRNMGNAIGISVMQRQLTHDIAASRAVLTEGVTPDNPIVGYARPDLDLGTAESAARMTGEIARQASMVGYTQLYTLAFLLGICAIPLVLLMRPRRNDSDDSSDEILQTVME